MYEAYFGLKENPFSLSPDPRYFYLSPQHRECLNHIAYGITERKGFITITGGIGTGKTTLCRSLLKTLDATVETALIFNPAVSDLELLETIVQEFRIPLAGEEKTKKRYIDALNHFLLENFKAGKNAVLIIDEAQNLPHNVLEQIRLLSNLETDREKLLQIILIGQPELQDLLAIPTLRQLNQRITVRYHLTPLNREETARYMEHRLTVACGQITVTFTRWSQRLLYRHSGGNPRRINAICDRALLVAYTRNLHVIGRRIIKDAVFDLGKGYFNKIPGPWHVRWLRLSPLILLLFISLILAGLFFSELK
jgi:general secretion pathway protein A